MIDSASLGLFIRSRREFKTKQQLLIFQEIWSTDSTFSVHSSYVYNMSTVGNLQVLHTHLIALATTSLSQASQLIQSQISQLLA